MVRKLNNEINSITLDNEKSRTACGKLLYDNRDRDRTMCDLTELVKKSLDPPSGRLPQPDGFQPQPIIFPDLIDNNGNLRATDIGITWQALIHSYMETRLLYQMLWSNLRDLDWPYQPVRDHGGCNISTPRHPPILPTCLEIPDTCAPLRRTGKQTRLPTGTELNWSSWFRYFRVVADAHVWMTIKGPYSWFPIWTRQL